MVGKSSGFVSDKDIAGLPAPATGNKIYYGTKVNGFGVRVTAAGARSFILTYRIGRRQRRMTIGSYPAWSLASAIKEAKELRKKIDTGIDPLGEREQQRDAVTVDKLCDIFIEEHLPKKAWTTQRDYKQIIDTYIRPDLKHVPVADVDYMHANKIFRKVSKSGKKTAANRVMSVMSKMFTEAQKMKLATINPTKGVEKNDEAKRERFLDSAEVTRLIDALATLEDKQAANIFRFILLTGCRKTEALAAEWSMIDLSDGTWTKPSHHTKQKKVHKVPLSAPARQLLADIVAEQGSEDVRFIFPAKFESTKPSTTQHQGHRVNVKNQWAQVLKSAKLKDLRIHDLRHSFASFLVAEGMSLALIGRLLGHTQAATTHRYAHLALDPLRAATERVGTIVSAKSGSSNVIDLRKELK
ncbi:site-specific integrase [Agrobacterium sp. SORGH_AS 787]|uniref:tyrosine-type recombinase/integrase n=1 Tax=Agrobacterium sp. SORGH_AS 787 TaxID=3041775 RepID=UPI0027805FCF|nr:integrase [Rhizobium sp. SORGH_AS_0787]